MEMLEERKGGLHCGNCLRLWERKKGILSFMSGHFLTGDGGIQNTLLKKISEMTRLEMEDYLASHNSENLKKFSDALRNNRADGLYFLPIGKNDLLLDLGCGPGSLSIPAAGMCRHVFAFDHSLSDLMFLEIRKKNDSIANITTIHGEPTSLPFGPESFDHIAMNGAVEYIGNFVKGRDPLASQKDLLTLTYRLLKKGGHLFLSAPNRYGLDFFYRERDVTGLYLAGVVPRVVAKFIMFVAGGKTYTTYSHTIRGYRKLLREAGYENIIFYFTWPDYRNPKYIVPEGNRNIFTYYRENFMKTTGAFEYRFFKTASILGIEDFFAPYLIITAGK